MHPISTYHWITGIALAAVLHVGAGWALFRESPEPGAMPSTGISVEIFSSGLESLAASGELDNVEMIEESEAVEIAMEPETESLEVAETEPTAVQEMVEEVSAEPVRQITREIDVLENIAPEVESVAVETAEDVSVEPPLEQVIVEEVNPEPVQERTATMESLDLVEAPVIDETGPVQAEVEPEPVQEISESTESREYVEVASTAYREPVETETEPAPAEEDPVVDESVQPAPARQPTRSRVGKAEISDSDAGKEPRTEPLPPSRVSDTDPDTGNARITAQSSAAVPAVVEQPGINTENIRNSYFASISAMLAQAKRYPKRAVRRKLEGTVKVNLVIDRNGELVSFNITHSSRHRVLDREVERMIQRSAPYPEIPVEIAGNTLSITVPVEFFLR